MLVLLGKKKFLLSKVLIIGIGGLGCPLLLLYLANSGVGNLGIADNDKIELSNLNRQILYTQKDIGKLKLTRLKRKFLKLIKILRLNLTIQELNEKII